MVDEVPSAAYSRRAAEYIENLGSLSAVHRADLELVSEWAGGVDGDIIDAGCGPGHLTNFLAEQGHSASGVDLAPDFVEHASRAYPGVDFTLGSIDSLESPSGSVGGILSWFSVIHYEPEAIQVPLAEFSRALKPGGVLLLGFFEGARIERFAHAVTAAYRWPVDWLSAELDATGFDIVESRVRTTAGQRSQAAIIARRRDTR